MQDVLLFQMTFTTPNVNFSNVLLLGQVHSFIFCQVYRTFYPDIILFENKWQHVLTYSKLSKSLQWVAIVITLTLLGGHLI